jgi:glycosyltransferase involved in cell wall biosynthesis
MIADARQVNLDQPCIELSVVMPCLNEADTLADCIELIRRTVAQHDISAEIIVADNGSTDGSPAIAEAHGARVVHVECRGYGSALRGGINAARGRYIIMGDADMSYDFSDIPRFLNELRAGAELVMGNRFRGGIRRGAMPALHRYLGNPILTGIGKLLFRSRCGDFHCGLRGFTKDAVQRMDLHTTGMEFASEMVVKATLFRLRVAEVPTSLSPDGRRRPPHLRSWPDGWRHLRFLLMYSPRWLFLYPGATLMIIGLALGVWLMPGPRQIGRTVIDIHTLLFAALAILIGFQGILFAVYSKTFATIEGLLPEDDVLSGAFRFFTLERGLALGGALTIVGIGVAIYTTLDWSSHSFGKLNPVHMVRLVACAMVLITLGVQITLSSFFLSILRLPRRT